MIIERIDKPIYRVEFDEYVMEMLKEVLGNMDLGSLTDIGVDPSHHDTLVEFYNLLDSI